MTAIDLNRKQKLVYDVIKEYPEAANDDNVLLERVWMREGWNQNRSLYENLSRVSNSETLTRRRRELFNMGLISYSKKADDRRVEAFKNERERATQTAIPWMDD